MEKAKPKVAKKAKPATKYTPTAKESKNLKDAAAMKNMRPVFKSGGKCKHGCK